MTAPMSASSRLEALPPNVLLQLVVLLPDPSALAATSRALAALLNEDALLLAWWDAQHSNNKQSRLAAAAGEVDIHTARHPGYALLYWRRVHSFSTQRLAALLLRQASSGAPSAAQAAISSRAQQLLDTGDAVGAAKAVLPHSERLLLPCAAHAGHTQLLSSVLAAVKPAAPAQVHLQWGEQQADFCLLLTAARAAVRGGHVATLQALLPALVARDQHSDAVDLGVQLMEFAVDAGNCSSTACVSALLELCHLPQQYAGKEHVWHNKMLRRAAESGSAAAVAVLLGAAGHRAAAARKAAYDEALRRGHLHVLPLLRPPGISREEDEAVALDICYLLMAQEDGDRNDVTPQQLALLPQAMWRIWHREDVEEVWVACLQNVLNENSVATMEAIWACFARPADRGPLCAALLQALGNHEVRSHPDVAQWLLRNAMPDLTGAVAAADEETLHQAWQRLICRGHLDLCDALAPAEISCKVLIGGGHSLHNMQRAGLLLYAVHRGDVAAVRAAVQAPNSSDDDVQLGLCSAAFTADPEAAEAVVRVLGAAWLLEAEPHHFYVDEAVVVVDALLLAQGGRLIRVLCELKPAVLAIVAGQAGADTSGSYLAEVCGSGELDLAWWMLCQPGQKPTALSSLLLGRELVITATERVASVAALLLRAVSMQSGGKMSELPAGMRQLTAQFLGKVLECGDPDLLQAVLAFVDGWGPPMAG